MKRKIFLAFAFLVLTPSAFAAQSCLLEEIKYIDQSNGIDYVVESFYSSKCQVDQSKTETKYYNVAELGDLPFLGLINLFTAQGLKVGTCSKERRPSQVVRFEFVDIQKCLSNN